MQKWRGDWVCLSCGSINQRDLLKNFGASAKNEFVINELAKIDKIFAYGSLELVQAKPSLGSDLTNEDIILHHQG